MPATLYVPNEQQLQTPFDMARGHANRVLAGDHLKLPISFNTADAAVLFTMPTIVGVNGTMKLYIGRLYWEITTSFTGGSSSAIGISSSNANYNTKGDLLGGASGDVAATLVSTGVTYKGGTLGTKYGSNGVIVLAAGDTIRFDRITSAFTAGAGFVHANVTFID